MNRDGEPARKRPRVVDRLRSAANLSAKQRSRPNVSPFAGDTFAEPATEQTLQSLAFADAVAFCSASRRLHNFCAQSLFWRNWLRTRVLYIDSLQLRSRSDASLDRALMLAANENDSDLSAREFMYLLKLVQGLSRRHRKGALRDFWYELLRQSHLQSDESVEKNILERKWRHFFDATTANEQMELFAEMIEQENVLDLILAARQLSDPIARALLALPNAYGENEEIETSAAADLRDKRVQLRKILLLNSVVSLVDASGAEHKATSLQAAIALGSARLTRWLLQEAIKAYRSIETSPKTLPYRRQRVRESRRALLDSLCKWSRACERTENKSGRITSSTPPHFPNALCSDSLEAIIKSVQ